MCHLSMTHIVQQGFSFIDMTRLLLCATGTGLPTDIAGNLKSGNCSESLDVWLSGMLHPNRNPDQSLAVHIKLLLACNSALELVKVTGCEATLHSLASSWLAASDGTDAGSPEVAAAAAPSDQQTDTAPNTAVWHALSANLLADLAETTCQLPLALQATKIGSGSAEIGFPKFQKLIGFLKGMIQEKSAWHGMIFVKTRQGVHELVSLLRKTPAVAEHVAFHAFTGHAAGKSTSGNPAWTSHLNTLHRMKVKDQAAILHSFKNGQGRQVLIATAAAEEGLDIPTCEFVLCYTAVETGREWTQRQGRARMLKSQFVHLLEQGTADEAQLVKSKQQAENEYAALLHSCSTVN
jgi:hypothetical protein